MDGATTENTSLEQVLRLLGREKLADDEFLREALWLAQFIPGRSGQDPQRVTPGGARPAPQKPGDTATETKGGGEAPPPPAPAPPGPQPVPDSLDHGRLYPKVDQRKDTGRKGSPIYVPASGALPQPLELARALRPFQQKFRSRRVVRLDVDATVELSAESREVTPVLVREKERWFSISLLVDEAPSMAVWRKTARELAKFLERLGIFRDLRSWSVDQDLRLTSHAGREAPPKQLADPTGRTLILVLTNGVGRHWQSREMAEWLTAWARKGPVAICSLLPPIRWQHTDLGPAYLWARSSVPGAGNRLLTAGEGPKTVTLKDGATVFPVFPLTKHGLEEWAAMQMSRRETKVSALPISPTWFDPRSSLSAEPVAQEDVGQRLAQFRSFASPYAARLLQYFSAIPLSLPVMRLVQHTMMPESPLSAMAEVLMSGLVVPSRTAPPGADAESTLFDFSPEARKYLRDRTSIGDLEKIHHEVSGAVQEYIERRAGVSVIDFEAWVDDPAGLKDMPPDVQYFAEVTAETLRALGYSRRRRPPEPPADRPALYVIWDLPEMEELAQQIATGLRNRGLRVLIEGRDDFPPRGSILMVAGKPEVFESEHMILTEQFARVMESGLDATMLVGPGVTQTNKTYLYADSYASREEMLEAIIAEVGKRDVNAAPRPKGAPPLEPGSELGYGADFHQVQQLIGQGTVAFFSNPLFVPRGYVRDLIWTREARLKFPGGIRWGRHGDDVEEKAGQLLVLERPNRTVKVPAGCSALLLDPDVKTVIDLPESTIVYEGDPEAIRKLASEAADRLRDTFPASVLEELRHSPYLVKRLRELAEDENFWPRVRERFGQEWPQSQGGSVIGLELRLLITSIAALEPPLRDAAGMAVALQDRENPELVDRLIPSETRGPLDKIGLADGSTLEPAPVWRKLAPMTPYWAEWNAKVLEATGVLEGDWLDNATRNPYARRHLMYHFIQTGNLTMIEWAATNFGLWALRIENDGAATLVEDLRSLPGNHDIFRQIQAFLNSLPNAAELKVDDFAAAILRYDPPLPQALRDSARSKSSDGASSTPSRFILLAGTRDTGYSGVGETAQWASEEIAREIARRGFGLICGAEHGSDSFAVAAFAEQKTAMGVAAGPAVQIVTVNDHPVPFPFPPGTKLVFSEDQVAESVRLADTVVILGGNQWVARVAHAALAAGKAVYPVPAARGAAENVFREQVAAGRFAPNVKWAAGIETKTDAGQVAQALLDDISGVSPKDSRLEVLCACRSLALPPFIVNVLGSSPVDEVLVKEGRIRFDDQGGILVEPQTYALYHGRDNPGIHARISEAIEANPNDAFSLRMRLFHLIKAGHREKAVSVATDLSWLIPAAELGDPGVFEDLLSLGLDGLVADLQASNKPLRARLAESRTLEIARAAIRYGHASTYVEVAGTGSHRIDEVTQSAAEAVGLALAQAGFGLITGAWPGVDYVVADTYLKGGGKSLVHALTESSTDQFGEALAVDARDVDTSEKLADGVVLIGGLGGTMDNFRYARALGKPVFPYGPSGGDARRVVAMLAPGEAGPMQTELLPEEFAAFVIRQLGGGKESTGLERMRQRAEDYDQLRKTMRGGPERTTKMTELFEQMLKEAPALADHLTEFQLSPSAGLRLAAIAILQIDPRREQLDWLVERLDYRGIERPFVGYQAAVALGAAVKALKPEDCDILEQSLEKARELAKDLPAETDRMRELSSAELELMRKRNARDEELDVTRLIQQELLQRGYSDAVLTRNLLIFRTKGQRTWLSFTTAGVFCVLDNRPRGEDYLRIQWFQLLREIEPAGIRVQDRPDRTGLLNIGSHPNWLYSRQLFDGARLKEMVLKELKRANEFRERAERYSLE